MRKSVVTKSLTASSANNISLSQSLAGAGALLINGAAASGGVATLDTQRRVTLASAGNDAGITWTVIGTNDNGSQIKDVFAGVNNPGIAQSNLDFKTVISITASGATASTVTAGTSTVGSTPWQLFSDTINTPNLSVNYQLVSGTQNASVEYTYDAFLVDPTLALSAIALGPASPNPQVILHPVLQAMTASKDGIINWTITGWRLTVNSGTGVGQMTSKQAGLASP